MSKEVLALIQIEALRARKRKLFEEEGVRGQWEELEERVTDALEGVPDLTGAVAAVEGLIKGDPRRYELLFAPNDWPVEPEDAGAVLIGGSRQGGVKRVTTAEIQNHTIGTFSHALEGSFQACEGRMLAFPRWAVEGGEVTRVYLALAPIYEIRKHWFQLRNQQG